ncbi:MAG: phosphoribosylaminoimidazolesuccinocarboxamide synthase [Promicromonosporaceae bacterium]|nr:phosphoribosylaminoimidazolesuccinocarboxamide synthase [Promicromonosporaceae bacterium]
MTDALTLPGWRHAYSGKVRDLYVPSGSPPRDDVILVVASDRISAHDFLLEPPIPGKGAVLTQLSNWWFDQLTDIVPNHRLASETGWQSGTTRAGAQSDEGTTEPSAHRDHCRAEASRQHLPDIPVEVAPRAMLCKRLEMFPVECVARGYLTGSGLAEYQATGSVTGIELPPGLKDGSRLPEPIFTPALKAEVGRHDENVPFVEVERRIGAEVAARLRDLTLAIYARAESIARERGLILADTKFEFGINPAIGEITLGDEVLTPDSSRFWPADEWEPGRPQPSFDKQYVRDWLTGPTSGWNRDSTEAPPPLPADVVTRTQARYHEAFTRLTGCPLP